MALDEKKPGKARLVGAVGVVATATLLWFVPVKEGTRLTPYYDSVGVKTVCVGSTKNVENRLYTPEECAKLLEEELADHAEGALKCINKPTTEGQRAAYTSFAFNVGITAFCRSTLAKKHNAGDYRGACAELSRWVFGGTQVLPGLVIRRAEERKMCEKGLE